MIPVVGLRIRCLKDGANVLGLILRQDSELDLDIFMDQVDVIRASVDAGEIAMLRGAEIVSPPPPPMDAPASKGKGK